MARAARGIRSGLGLAVNLRCPACGFDGDSLDPASCGRCGVVFARYHAAVPAGPFEQPTEVIRPTSTGVLVAGPAPTENYWAVPGAFLLAAAINATGFGKLIIFASAGNWAHELGHASWRWLNGRSALPALFFTFYFGENRSVVTELLVLGGLVALFLWARNAQCDGLQVLAVLFFLVFWGFVFFVPPARERFLESFAGLFGELWIGALAVVLFYYRFPFVARWPRLRWAFLLLGAFSFTHLVAILLASRHDMSLLPWGAFFGGDGDLDHLLEGGWLVPTIRRVYFTIAGLCGAVVLGHYLYFAQQTLRRQLN